MTDKQRFPILKNAYFRLIVSSGTALLLVAFVILRYEGFFAAVRAVFRVLRPLLLGILFALVLNRPCSRFEQDIARRHNFSVKTVRCLAIAATVAMTLLILTGIVCILLPQLCESVALLTENLQFYGNNLGSLLARLRLPAWLSQERIDEVFSLLQKQIPSIVQAACGYTAGLLGCLLDVGIGAVFSVYLLADQERLQGQLRSIAARILSPDRVQKTARTAMLVGDTFAQFLRSQLTEAGILGGLCFLGMLLLRMPFPVLISVIIGVTNIVPYVGPILGTIPCAAILLLVKPMTAVWFVVFVVILQQIESNLIFPRIVGRSVGLPPAWVLSAIVLGGGFCGAIGMLLSVPLTAVIYALLFQNDNMKL